MKHLIRNISKKLSTKRSSILLNDSLLLKGLQCKKLFWLEQHRPDLKVVDDSGAEWKRMVKEEVEAEALNLFDNALKIKKSRSPKSAAKATQKAINANALVILDAVFIQDAVATRIDAMVWEEVGYSLYEIKSSAGIKDVYFNEAALKWALLTRCKVPLSKSYILHINNKYTRRDDLDIRELFHKKNITQVVRRRQEEVIREMDELLSIKKDKPNIHIGSWCNDPYECEFKSHCWRDVPTPSVFDLHKLPGNKKFELYRQGVVRLEDIPRELELKASQRRQIDAEKDHGDYVDKEAIGAFLKGIRYPVYFLDFETFQQAVPRFENLRPFEQIPFQFSLHIVRHEGAEAEHIEFLAQEGSDPRHELARRLVEVMGSEGTILAYNQSFEKGVVKRLAENYEELSEPLQAMLVRFEDLMRPFEKGMYYTKKMNGRHSIKAVLPALIPELSYASLAIGHGGEAMSTYATLHRVKGVKKVKKIRENLLEYCKLDTLAMVKIWEKLKETR